MQRGGANQMRDVFRRIAMTPEQFQFRAFTRVDQLWHLLRTAQIDANLYWADESPASGP